MTSRVSVVTITIVLLAGFVLNSCVTTQGSRAHHEPQTELELLAALEQTREINLEDKLTYALSRLFGVDNVLVLVSSYAHHGTTEEREKMQAAPRKPQREFRRRTEPGEIERLTIAVIINANVLTQEQKRDLENLREQLFRIVVDGAGLLVGDESRDSVSVLFMPFTD